MFLTRGGYLGAVLAVVIVLVLPAVECQVVNCPDGQTLTTEIIMCRSGEMNDPDTCMPSSPVMLTGTLQTICFPFDRTCNIDNNLVPTFNQGGPNIECTATALTCVTPDAGNGGTPTTDTNTLILQLIQLLQALGGVGGGNGESVESGQIGGNGGLLDLLAGTGNGGGALLGFLAGAANGNGGSRSR